MFPDFPLLNAGIRLTTQDDKSNNVIKQLEEILYCYERAHSIYLNKPLIHLTIQMYQWNRNNAAEGLDNVYLTCDSDLIVLVKNQYGEPMEIFDLPQEIIPKIKKTLTFLKESQD